MAKTFSLCITTQHSKNTEQSILFRLADKFGDEFLVPLRGDENVEYEENIWKYPYDQSKNYVIGELKVWEWDPTISKWAQKSMIPVYELFRVPALSGISENDLIEILKDGQVVEGYHGQAILLVIEESEDSYRVVYIDSSYVNVYNETIRMKCMQHPLKGYDIKKCDIISTENVIVLSEEGKQFAPRLIYKYTNLPTPDFYLDVLSFNDKIDLFVKKQIKTRNYTKAQRREFVDLFNEIIADYELIEQFFEENGFKEENLESKLDRVNNCIADVLDEDSTWDQFCSAMIDNLPILKEKYMFLVENSFKQEKKDMINLIESEISATTECNNQAVAKAISLKDQLHVLDKKRNELVQDIEKYSHINNTIQDALKNKISELKGNVTEFLAEMAIFSGFTNSENLREMEHTILSKSHFKGSDCDVINSLNELTDALSENLVVAGIEKENKISVAKFVIGTFQQNNFLCITGKYARNVADAISATICASTADVISILSPNITYSELISKIERCSNRIVVIENLITQNELVAVQLVKSKINHRIIFTQDISESINFMPSSIWDRLNLLCLDYFCERNATDDFMYSELRNVQFENNLDKYTYKAALEEIEGLKGKYIFTKSQFVSKAELIALIDETNDKEGLFSWLICELIPYQIITNEIENFEKIMNAVQLSEKHAQMIQKKFW